MRGFEFRKDPTNRVWVVVAPRRAVRPDVARGKEPLCPFCAGNEHLTPKEIARVGKGKPKQPGWEIRVTANKFPFAPIHEIIIHSPGHTESFFTYKPEKVRQIFRIYRERSLVHEDQGQVVIFHNHGRAGAESLPHSHTQLTVIPNEIILNIPLAGAEENIVKKTKFFVAYCPNSSQWPEEVWIVSKERGKFFKALNNQEIADLADLFIWLMKRLQRIIEADFPFNFYIYSGADWYLRIIPRIKQLGGFELSTGIIVNSEDPAKIAKQIKG